jgi:hypothetical protein
LQVSDDGKSFRSLGRIPPTKFHGWQDEIWPELVKLVKDSGVSDYNYKDKGNQKLEILKWDSFLCPILKITTLN